MGIFSLRTVTMRMRTGVTCGLEVPDRGSIAIPSVIPPAKPFRRLSLTSVSSSSRLTRSDSLRLHSSSSAFSFSSRTGCVFLPGGRETPGCRVPAGALSFPGNSHSAVP